MGKTKCIRNIRCELCNTNGMLQMFFNSNNEVRYARIRHYIGVNPNTGKSRFVYHRQTLEYVQSILKQDNTDHIDHDIHDQKLNVNGSFTENVSGRSLVWLGHQPATLTTRVQISAAAPNN